MAIIEKDGKYGFIDKTGAEVIKFEYENLYVLEEGLIKFKTGNKWGLMDQKGNVILQPYYDYMKDFQEGLAQVDKNGQYGFIDLSGNEVIPLQYDMAFDFKEGLDGKYGFIDKTGQVVIPLQYENVDAFSEGLAWVQTGGKWGAIAKPDVPDDWAFRGVSEAIEVGLIPSSLQKGYRNNITVHAD